VVKRIVFFLLFPLAIAAQAVNHGAATSQGAPVMIAWTNPQAQGDTITAGVEPPGGTLTDTAGDTFSQDCVSGNQAIFRASPINIFTGNVLTYTPPVGAANVAMLANEQTGQWIPDSCGSGSGIGAVPLTPTSTTASGDLVYAMLGSSQCCSGTAVTTGMTFLNGLADTWFGPGYYSGWMIDAIGSPSTQGVTFTYTNGLGGGSGTGIMEALKSISAPQPVTLTFGPSTSALTPCTDTVTYDDGSPLFTSPAGFSITEQEGGAQVSIGTPTIALNGQVSGSVTVDPNYTTTGQVLLFATIGGIAGLPQIQAQPFDPRQLQQGSTGICIGVVLFKSITLPKYSVLGLTP
jgi:hypothetical protein